MEEYSRSGRTYVLNARTRFPSYLIFFNTIFVSSHMYPENPEETHIIVGSLNMGYIYMIYPTLPRIELTTCSVPSAS